MRITLQLVVQNEGGVPATVTEIAQFQRDGLDVGSLGLHLEEAKSLLGRLQRTMVTAQVAPRQFPGPAFVPRARRSRIARATITWSSGARSDGVAYLHQSPIASASGTP